MPPSKRSKGDGVKPKEHQSAPVESKAHSPVSLFFAETTWWPAPASTAHTAPREKHSSRPLTLAHVALALVKDLTGPENGSVVSPR